MKSLAELFSPSRSVTRPAAPVWETPAPVPAPAPVVTKVSEGVVHVRPLPEFTAALSRVFRSIPKVYPVPQQAQD